MVSFGLFWVEIRDAKHADPRNFFLFLPVYILQGLPDSY